MFNPRDHYWAVNGNPNQVFSSKAKTYVSINNATYLAWLDVDHKPTKIGTEAALWEVLSIQVPDLVPNITAAQAALKDRKVNILDQVALEIGFNQENRIRALEGKSAITKQQFITGIKGLI